MQTPPKGDQQTAPGTTYRPLLVLRREYEAADLGPDAVKGCFALPCRMPDVYDVPRDRLVGSNGKDAVLDGDRRQLKMLPFARLAQSSSLFVASLEFADHVATSCSTACIWSHWD
jgi:hypothetical protein